MGKLRLGTKSNLVECLEGLITSDDRVIKPYVEVIIFDGAAVINMLKPGSAKTFSEYAADVFLPYLASLLQSAKRVDAIWDTYKQQSLKSYTRSKRGKGSRRRLEPTTKIPGSWQAFLLIDENKEELFSFLATQAVLLQTECQIISTHNEDVLCKLPRDVTNLAPCSHEEADTRIMLHMFDTVKEGYCKIQIRTVDTDVLGSWEPLWTTLPQATDACRELLRCGCRKGCGGHCKCRKAALKCTSLCQCDGQCGAE